ncbi:hypothetical protein EMCRGX_G001526 [Ephydatia muelleri]
MVQVVVPVQRVDWLCFYLYGVNCSLVTSRKEKASQVIGKRHHTRRSSLSALSPRSQNPPPSGDAATHPTPQPWLLMAGGVASAHTKGNSWYSNLFGRKKGRSQEERADRPRPLGELQKSENVLGQEQDLQRPQGDEVLTLSIHPMVEPKKPEDRVERGLPLGSIQLSFSYSAQLDPCLPGDADGHGDALLQRAVLRLQAEDEGSPHL